MATACRTLALLALAATAASCSREPPPATASAGAAALEEAGPPRTSADGGVTSLPAAPAAADAGPSADAGPPSSDAGATADTPRQVPIAAAVAIVGGQELAIARDGGALVDPAAAFSVEIPLHLTDGRMALHDEQDAMVPSSGTTEIGGSWTRYRLVPEGPLRPGTSYALWVDGAVTRETHDPSGRAYLPLVLQIRTTGERPSAPARKKRGKRRH